MCLTLQHIYANWTMNGKMVSNTLLTDLKYGCKESKK